jgi:hypothetical protein
MKQRIKPGRRQSGPQTVAVPARNTGTLIPAKRGGLPTVPLQQTRADEQGLPLSIQRQTYTHPIRGQGYS